MAIAGAGAAGDGGGNRISIAAWIGRRSRCLRSSGSSSSSRRRLRQVAVKQRQRQFSLFHLSL